MKPVFKKGQTITAIDRGMGLEEATIMGIVDYKDRKHYKCSIPCGFALIPIEAQINYKLSKKK